jgi:hypothetical protein
MRRILLNRARDKKRAKRGGERRRVDLDQIEIALDTDDEQLIALDTALTELVAEDEGAARLVNLRFFAGLTRRRHGARKCARRTDAALATRVDDLCLGAVCEDLIQPARRFEQIRY